MEEKIIKKVEESGDVLLTLKSGMQIRTPSKTIYTHYDSGRIDCNVIIDKPIKEN